MAAKTRIKGNRNVRKAIVELEAKGYLVDKVEKTGKFIKQKDLFGLFDLIALKGGITKFIQITTNRPHTHGDYDKFAKNWQHCMRQIEQWVYHDRKGWVIYKYYKDMSKLTQDERTNNISK